MRWHLIAVLTCISLIIRDTGIFSRVYWPFVCMKNVCLDSLPIIKSGCMDFFFSFLLLSCLRSFYILDINILLDIWFFSHSVGPLFIILIINGYWILSNVFFCLYWEYHMSFIHYFTNVVYHADLQILNHPYIPVINPT